MGANKKRAFACGVMLNREGPAGNIFHVPLTWLHHGVDSNTVCWPAEHDEQNMTKAYQNKYSLQVSSKLVCLCPGKGLSLQGETLKRGALLAEQATLGIFT